MYTMRPGLFAALPTCSERTLGIGGTRFLCTTACLSDWSNENWVFKHALAPGDAANKCLAHSTRQGTSGVALISAVIFWNTAGV